MSGTSEKRVRQASRMLPDLVQAARKIHRSSVRVNVAVLCAWADLAGVIGWTPEMVRKVEQETRKGQLQGS